MQDGITDLAIRTGAFRPQFEQRGEGGKAAPQPHDAHDHAGTHDHATDTSAKRHWWPGTPASELTLDQILRNDPALPVGFADLPVSDAGASAAANRYKLLLARTDAELEEVIELRREAYGKHGRVLDIKLEPFDTEPNTAIFGVRDADGELFASMRVCFCFEAESVWSHKVKLPAPYSGARLAFFERLAIRSGGMRAARAKQTLFKAAYLLALGVDCEWIVISALPPLHHHFEALGFDNVFGENEMVSVDWYPDPFYILGTDVRDKGATLLRANRNWYEHIVAPDAALEGVLGQYFETHSSRSPSNRVIANTAPPLRSRTA